MKLAYLHAGIWWGALLLLLGLIYTIKFAPRSEPQVKSAQQ